MRITLLIVAGFLVIAGSGFFLLMKVFTDDVEHQYSQAAEEPLVDFAHLFASLIEEDVIDGKIDPARFRNSFQKAYRREFLAKIYQLEKRSIETRVYVTDKTGTVIFDSDEGQREGEDFSQYRDVYLTMRGQYGARASRTDLKDSRTTVFYIAAPIRFRDEIIGVLSVSRPETAMAPFAEEARAHVLRWSLLIGLYVVALASLWAYWLLHPIRDLTKHAQLVASGEKSELPAVGHAELKTLSQNLEAMRRELEGKHYVENYVQALTHELKSPLAAIRGAAELIDEKMDPRQRDRFLKNILAETIRTEDLVRRLVQLASLESQSSLSTRQNLDLAALLREEIDAIQSTAETKDLQVCAEKIPDGEVLISGDPLMMRIAMRNLLKNAVDFSPNDSLIEVACEVQEGGRILVSIKDEGPGIPDYATNRIFDRFYSLKNQETGRKGSGIGLSFVREAVELHGGSVSLTNRESGPGAVARVELEN